MTKVIKYLIAIFFVVMLGIGLSRVYKAHTAQQKDLRENYITTEATTIKTTEGQSPAPIGKTVTTKKAAK